MWENFIQSMENYVNMGTLFVQGSTVIFLFIVLTEYVVPNTKQPPIIVKSIYTLFALANIVTWYWISTFVVPLNWWQIILINVALLISFTLAFYTLRRTNTIRFDKNTNK